MSGRLRYRIDEARGAMREGGIGSTVRAVSARLASDTYGASRRLYARARARDGIVVLPIQGSSMALQLDDPGISRGLIRDGVREREHTQLIHEEIRPGMVGVDLGANLGYYALMEAKLVGANGRVIAIEPVPGNVEMLRQSAELNGYGQLEVHELAISDECSDIDMWVTPQSNFCNVLFEDDPSIKPDIRATHANVETAKRIRVPALTLDAFLERQAVRRLDFIRMDIEGHEIAATDGMRRTFEAASAPLRLFVEVHNNHFVDPGEIVAPWLRGLLEAGFRPKAFAVPKHPQGILRDLPSDDFPEFVCSFADSCPHVLLVKNG